MPATALPHLVLALVDLSEDALVAAVVDGNVGAQALPHRPRRLLPLRAQPRDGPSVPAVLSV